jgi:hypothetical protein
MANDRHQGQRRLNQHPFVVSIQTADFEIAVIALLRMKVQSEKITVRSSNCSMISRKWVS